MDDFDARSSAASRLRKGKGKKEKPDMDGMDDLGLPPEDMAPVDEGGAPPGGDLAALLGASPDASAPPPEGEAGMEMAPEGGQTDLEMALAGVDAALQGMAPEQAEEIRLHMNAIREIASKAGAENVPPMEPQMSPGVGMEKPGSGVIPS